MTGVQTCALPIWGTQEKDFNNRTIADGGDWNTTGGAAGTLNTNGMSLGPFTTVPTSGRTFAWTPTAYVPTYLANAAGAVQDFTTWVNGSGPSNVPSTNWATNGYGDASWQIDNNPGTPSTTGWYLPNNGAYSPVDYAGAVGGHSARFHSNIANYPQVGYLDYYVNLGANVGTPTLDFFTINPSGTDILQIFLSSNGGSTFTQIGGNIGASTTWVANSISLGATNWGTTIIRFKARSDFGSSDIGLDHVVITPHIPPPTITSYTPNTNLCAGGGQTVTINGTNFLGTTAVTFNLVNATSFNLISSTQITAVTPAGISTGGAVRLTTAGGTGVGETATVGLATTV